MDCHKSSQSIIKFLIPSQMTLQLILVGLLILNNFAITQQKATAKFHNYPTQSSCIDDCIEPFDDSILPIADKLEDKFRYDSHGRIYQMPADNGKGDSFKPSKIHQIRAKFDLYTQSGHVTLMEFEHKKRPVDQLGIDLCDMFREYPFNFSQMSEAQFDANKRTVIITPGYITLDTIDWFPRELAKLWLDLQDINIIVVTWRSANQGAYEQAIANIPFIARQTVILLHYLAKSSGTCLNDQDFLDKIHVIGHSCGAHIAGFIGKELGGKVGRISGFDPAGLHFEDFSSDHRLDRTDAKLVDVYYSNMGKLDKKTLFCSLMIDKFNGRDWMCPSSNMAVEADPNLPGAWLGIEKQIGHVNIYLNNGHKQPGCKDRAHLCDHGRSSALLYDFLAQRIELDGLPRSAMQRPLAFHAKDYESFRIGQGFNDDEECAWLMNDLNENRISGGLRTCSIPIDFLTSPREFRRELEQLHGIELDDDQAKIPKRFYLSTSTDQPLLPLDHFMLKLKIAPETNQTQWNNQCRLNIKASFASGNDVLIDRVQLEPDSNDLVALTFNHPRGLNIRINNELETTLQQATTSEWCDTNKLYLRGQLFPALSLSTSVDANSPQAKLPGPTNFKASSDDCRLEIEYASVEPVWTNSKTFYGLYNTDGNSSINLMDSQEFQEDESRRPRVVINAKTISLGLKSIIRHD